MSADAATVSCVPTTMSPQGPHAVVDLTTTTFSVAFQDGSFHRSGGTVTLRGGPRTIALDHDVNDIYPTYTNGGVYSGGETLTLSWPGDDVPAFSLSFPAPTNIAITSPPMPPSGQVENFLGGDWDGIVRWTGGTAGIVTIDLYRPNLTDHVATVPASDGVYDTTALQAGLGIPFGMFIRPDDEMLCTGMGGYQVLLHAHMSYTGNGSAIILPPGAVTSAQCRAACTHEQQVCSTAPCPSMACADFGSETYSPTLYTCRTNATNCSDIYCCYNPRDPGC